MKKMNHVQKSHSLRQERGMYLVLLIFVLFIVLAFLALMFGGGWGMISKSRMQNLANVAAIAGVDRYLKSPKLTEADKRKDAFDRINDILNRNSNVGIAAPLALQAENTDIFFGTYYREMSTASVAACGTDPKNYPCFKKAAPGTPSSAVHLVLRTTPTNKVRAFFGGFLGQDSFDMEAQATSTVVESCTAYLLDLSFSTVEKTHQFISGKPIDYDVNAVLAPNTPYRVPKSPLSGHGSFFTYDPAKLMDPATVPISAITTLPDYSKGKIWNCDDPSAYFLPTKEFNADLAHWCIQNRSAPKTAPLPGSPRPHFERAGYPFSTNMYSDEHFPSDYVLREVRGPGEKLKTILVDLRTRPEPLGTFMLAFNAGLRVIEKTGSAADKAFIMGFTADHFGRVVPPLDPKLGNKFSITSNLGQLVQLTNMYNAGKADSTLGTGGQWGETLSGTVRYPNYLDVGFFPTAIDLSGTNKKIFETTGTSVVKALDDAINVLATECSPSSRKVIVLATDGLNSCSVLQPGKHDANGVMATAASILASTSPTCAGADGASSMWGDHHYKLYKHSEYMMFHHILPALLKNNIALTTLFSSDSATVQMRNQTTKTAAAGCDSDNNDGNCYVSLFNPQQNGYGGYVSSPPVFATGAGSIGLPNCYTTTGPSRSLFDCRSYQSGTASDEAATFKGLGTQGQWKFGRPIAALSHTSIQSGGIFCPIMTPGAASDYIDHDKDNHTGDNVLNCNIKDGKTACRLKNSARLLGGYESRSLEYLNEGEQAARCVDETIGRDRFILVAPYQANIQIK